MNSTIIEDQNQFVSTKEGIKKLGESFAVLKGEFFKMSIV